MTKLNRQLYSRTPAVVVYDNRRLAVREIEYCRHPDSINQTDERITRHHYHARGYLVHSIDARLYEAQHSDPAIQPNLQQILSLGGAFSFSQHIDKGNNVNISDIENKISLNINAMKLVTEYQYTKPELVSQLIAIIEHTANSHPVLKERFIWGMADSKNIANNAVGKCIRHEDLAGRTEYDGYTLTGKNINELRIVTANAVKMNENSLNTQELSFKTSNFYDATGNLLRQIDASNHQREWDYDRAGFLKQSRVILHGTNKFFVIKAISYSAAGQKLRVEQGNGIVTTYEYETETQRLLHVKTQRPQGHALGMRVIQDLRYEYDPVGNVICLKNDAEATRYWRNQKVVPENRYVYDSLYQLVSATGRELTNQHTPASIQSQTITTLVKDAQSYTNYTRLYTYDRSGNLIKIRHHSLLAQQSFTQNICVSLRSNRALLENQHTVIGNIDEHFDAMGNQQQLSTEDLLQWDNRGTLAQVKSNNGNVEHYTYANQSQRLMKQQVRHLSGHYITSETYYLPNMEIWQSKRGAQVIEQREVLILMDNVRALLWKTGLPHGIKNNQLRYSYNDGMGNSGLETDGQGQLVSYEEYYPYGGTAIWSSENTVEANYKTIRYSGKERDSTGLYYYGYRYYQPWIGRWLSADPAGTVDGLNLYRMVRNNPVTLRDPDGRMPIPPAPPMAPPAPPMMGGAPLPPPVPGGMQAISKPRKTWGDPLKNANSTALSDQQGGNYPYYTGFFRTLYVSKIKHYNDISDIKRFVDEWQGINEKSQRKLIKENINEQKVLYLQNKLNKMEEEWPKYVKTHEKTTYRGDGLSISETYPWFKDFVDEVKNKDKAVLKQVNIPVSAVSIMSTATTPKSGYVSNANVMWHFNLESENLGVSMPVYKGEDEVTFPVYNKMKITSLQYLPEGSSYMNNPEKFGSSHRYIINANMLPRG
ncbi:RHS repeat domain-containing protein [Proteus mirabilis]|uniref:RHS repeat domain-containing protein n=1 Tax=Proteus mirabilis TaxID=584 RepID=UPI0039B4BF46